MRGILICISLLVIFPFRGNAQVYGYLGMRNLIEAEAGFSPVIQENVSPDVDGKAVSGLVVNKNFRLNAYRVVSPSLSLGMHAEYMPLRAWRGNIPVRARNLGFGMGVRLTPFYRKGIEAPLGPVTEFGFTYVRSHVDTLPETNFSTVDLPLNMKFLFWRLALGYNYIYKDRFVIRPSLAVTLPLRLEQVPDEFRRVAERIRESRFLMAHISFGVLL